MPLCLAPVPSAIWTSATCFSQIGPASSSKGAPRDSGAPALSRPARASVADFAQLALQACRQPVEAVVDRDLLRVHLLQHGRPVAAELGDEQLLRDVDAGL